MGAQERKFDKRLYEKNASNFIPLIAHYNDETILTKNGELIQIIYIRGLNQENVSSHLSNLSAALRESLIKNASSTEITFWIQTSRSKIDLDYHVEHQNFFAGTLCDLWVKKHYWNEKYANSLYVSVVYKPADLSVKNSNAFINSFFESTVSEFHESYLSNCCNILSRITNAIISDLQEFNARKLSVLMYKDEYGKEYPYSEILSFYNYCLSFHAEHILMYAAPLDKVVADFYYALGTNVIEVVSEEHKKFIAILSIREHHHMSLDNLDYLLQVSSEMMCTEVCYFIKPETCRKDYSYQNYVLQVSNDNRLARIKGYDKIFDKEQNLFCEHQTLITIPSDSLEELDKKVKLVSDRLASLGIVHLREDMMLEHAFWSQMAGNFKFLRRLKKDSADHIAGFASLHNFPIGDIKSEWGGPITILRTKVGTPYFFNFHKGKLGHTCIYGGRKSGKTTVMNFLISQSLNLRPAIIYLAKNDTSELFIKSIDGKWYDPTVIFNPLLLSHDTKNARMILEFFKISCGHYDAALTDDELKILMKFVEYIYSLPKEQKKVSVVYHAFEFGETESGVSLKKKLSILVDPKYDKIFDTSNEFNVEESSTIGIDLYKFSDESFKKLYYPDDEKLVPEYLENFKKNKNIRAAYALTLLEPMIRYQTQHPHMLCVDDFFDIFGHIYFSSIYENLCNAISKNRGIILSTCDIDRISNYDQQLWDSIFNINATRIMLPMDSYNSTIGNKLHLSKEELKEFSTLVINNRLMLIKQATEDAITVELNLGSFHHILKILSCQDDDIKRYKKAVEASSDKPEEWLLKFYEMLKI